MAYAETTVVPVEKSIAEIVGRIKRAGAVRIGQIEDPESFTIQFFIRDRMIRFREGVEWRSGCWATYGSDGRMICGGSPDPIEAFRCLWVNINGNGSWEANPWIAALTFDTRRGNIDGGEG